ncbi:MAG: hypothetical protein K0R75_3982 [Paenibacillaceae bacterium]|nr:hypothetical protein [Paenibacillaceae bacterium]
MKQPTGGSEPQTGSQAQVGGQGEGQSSGQGGSQAGVPSTAAEPAPGASVRTDSANPNGIYALWYDNNNSDVFNLPYVKGGQISVQWGDLQTGPDTYNWAPLDAGLAEAAKDHRIVSVQANGNNKPAYLFDNVPYTSNWGEVQVRDKRGVLMYWHPIFEKAYLEFIAHFADHLNHSPYRSTILGVRQNFNAVGTEKLPVPKDKQPLSAWTIPAGDKEASAWTKKAQLDYQKKVLDAFVNGFVKGQQNPIPVFVRNNLEEQLVEPYKEDFSTGVLSWFHTSSELSVMPNRGPALGGITGARSILAGRLRRNGTIGGCCLI